VALCETGGYTLGQSIPVAERFYGRLLPHQELLPECLASFSIAQLLFSASGRVFSIVPQKGANYKVYLSLFLW
jgi:hypothetical protein